MVVARNAVEVTTMREFNSFLKFSEHLIVLGVTNHIVEHQVLERACIEIEARAKEKIGEYQSAAGPFCGLVTPRRSNKRRPRRRRIFPQTSRCCAPAICATASNTRSLAMKATSAQTATLPFIRNSGRHRFRRAAFSVALPSNWRRRSSKRQALNSRPFCREASKGS